MNLSGDIIGYYKDGARNEHSFVLSGGEYRSVNVPGSVSTRAVAINASGQIAGYFYSSDGNHHGFLASKSGGESTQIDPPGATRGTYATAMNDLGQIVGYYQDSAHNNHGFLLSAGTYTIIDPPGATQDSSALGINNSGQILGLFADSGGPNGFQQHGYLFSNGVFTQIDAPGAVDITTPIAMNASGQVVGHYIGSDDHDHGFLFSKGAYTNIDPPNGRPPLISDPAGINDFGQVVGNFQNCTLFGVTEFCSYLLSGNTFTTIYATGGIRPNLWVINNAGQLLGIFGDAFNQAHIFMANAFCLHDGGDTDSDGLCDNWERDGLNVNVNGNSLFLDLPAMGANPLHKDVFVQLDNTIDGEVPQSALDVVIAAFKNAPVSNPDGVDGINIHIDNGQQSIMNPVTGDLWGKLSRANSISDVTDLGNFDAKGDFDWSIFDGQKIINFPTERAHAFHYAISEGTQIFNADGTPGAGGIARGIPASDFIVAIGQTSAYPDAWVGSDFMHELGHNLGLGHGGGDDINGKPNYLSIMNYDFSYSGLMPGGVYDYSRFGPGSDILHLMPILDQAHLDEATGLGTSNQPVGAAALRFESMRFCPIDHTMKTIQNFNQPIDWDCNQQAGSPDDNRTDISVPEVTGDKQGAIFVLVPYDDWGQLIYRGGAIGSMANVSLPSTTHNTEPTPAQLQDIADFWAGQEADTVPPATTVKVSPQPNEAGWNNTNVTINLNAVDNPGGSGVKQITYSAIGAQTIAITAVSGASAVINLTSEGKTTITYFATDIAGNAESPHMLTVQIDKTPPTITATATPQPNVHGWNNTDVTVSFACADSLSGLAPNNPPAATVLSSEGIGQSVTGTCTDIAGNSASATVANINIDKTPPTITGSRTPLPNANGWNNTDVTVSFACSDSLSGIDTCGPENQVVSAEGTNQSRTGTAVDLAGNTAATTVSGINIDKTPPTMSCSATPNVLWPPNNKLVPVNASIALTDSLSGSAGFQLSSVTSNEPDSGGGDIVGWKVGTASTSGELRATRLGNGTGRTYTLLYSGYDKAGNTATCASTVSVPHDQGNH